MIVCIVEYESSIAIRWLVPSGVLRIWLRLVGPFKQVDVVLVHKDSTSPVDGTIATIVSVQCNMCIYNSMNVFSVGSTIECVDVHPTT